MKAGDTDINNVIVLEKGYVTHVFIYNKNTSRDKMIQTTGDYMLEESLNFKRDDHLAVRNKRDEIPIDGRIERIVHGIDTKPIRPQKNL